ncbi:hypothetical protein PFISCL1PPCAC_5043, partial [Pristionchus fissidentatus]
WNIVLEHVLSAAAVGRTFSAYFGDLSNHVVDNFAIEHARVWPWSTVAAPNATEESFGLCSDSNSTVTERSLIGYYPDFTSIVIIMIAAFFVGIGSKTMSVVNIIFQIANLLVILGVVGYGGTFADLHHWKDFFPCGMNGVLAGASKCFFAYVGFDGLATAGEEAKNPSKQIPRATYYSMFIVTTAYVLMAATLSLMIPYYHLTSASVYSEAFEKVGAPRWFSIVLGVGALLGIMTSALGSLFSLPRAVYAMADDGLIFGWWGKVNGWTKTPLNATITFTLLSMAVALTFDLDALVDFLSVGTLLAYSIVAAALLILRYRPCPIESGEEEMDQGGKIREGIPIISSMFANTRNGVISALLLMMACFTQIGISITMSFYLTRIGQIVTGLCAFISILCMVFIDMHQQNSMKLEYKVFLVPYIPSCSLFVNIIMLTQLTVTTWIRLIVWMAIGLTIYLLYGMRHSQEELRYKKEQEEKKAVMRNQQEFPSMTAESSEAKKQKDSSD